MHAVQELFTSQGIFALLQVIWIDLVLAADNAVVVGMAAAGLPREQRRKVIVLGIAAATVMRILFALLTTQLLMIVGLMLAGGILLLWVSWKLWREIQADRARSHAEEHPDAQPGVAETTGPTKTKTFGQAVFQVVLADITMSLDNVLAVAGAAKGSNLILIIGLIFSVAFMGFAATWIAGLLQRHRWIAYLGLAVIVWVSFDMIYRGADQVMREVGMTVPALGMGAPAAQ